METERKVSEAKRRANKKYDAAHYETISIKLPIGTKAQIRERGYTVNGLINQLVKDYLAGKSENK